MNNIEVYKIYCSNTNDFYIGSSVSAYTRWTQHRKAFNKNTSNKLYDCIRLNGGFENWKFEVIARDIPIEQQRIKEQEYIDQLKPNLNERRAYTSKEMAKELRKQSEAPRKEELALKKKLHREKPEVKEKEKEQHRIYREQNKEKCLQLTREWRARKKAEIIV